YTTDDVVRNGIGQQEDREQRRDDQDCVLLHSILLVFDVALVESELAQRRRSAHLPCGRLSTCAPTEWRHASARTTSLRRRAESGGRTAATSAGTHSGAFDSSAERHLGPRVSSLLTRKTLPDR